ncbi:MAG: hypothetical protein K6T26_06715 [Alicyclobacillus sp.]|nr:hypothetical protein [Alicyclobacillus sp.]
MCARRWLACTLAVLGVASLSACGGASTSPPGSGNTANSAALAGEANAAAGAATSASAAVPAPDWTFYKGKTIRLIAPDSRGGVYDTWARLMAPYLAKVLDAKIDVVNIPGAGTLIGTHQLSLAAPDGLTFGMVDTSGDVADLIEHVPGEDFDLSKFTWLGRVTQNTVGIYAQPNAGVHSANDLLQYRGSPLKVVDIRSSVGDMAVRGVLHAYGVPFSMVYGYSSSKEQVAGFLRGDGQLAAGDYSVWSTVIEAKKAQPLLVVTMQTSPLAPGVPALGTLLSQHPPAGSAQTALQTMTTLLLLGKDIAAPAGVPAARAAALQAAVQQVLQDPDFLAAAKQRHLEVDFEDGQHLQQDLQRVLGNLSELEQFLQ